MMQNPVDNFGFLNISKFWVIDVKWTVGAVAICFVFQRQMQIEQIICQIPFEQLNVFLFPLAATKFFPC